MQGVRFTLNSELVRVDTAHSSLYSEEFSVYIAQVTTYVKFVKLAALLLFWSPTTLNTVSLTISIVQPHIPLSFP